MYIAELPGSQYTILKNSVNIMSSVCISWKLHEYSYFYVAIDDEYTIFTAKKPPHAQVSNKFKVTCGFS